MLLQAGNSSSRERTTSSVLVRSVCQKPKDLNPACVRLTVARVTSRQPLLPTVWLVRNALQQRAQKICQKEKNHCLSYLTKELWKSSAQVLNVVKLLEQQWEGDGSYNLALAVDIFEKAKRVYQSMCELLHPYHLGLHRAAALCVAICAHLKSLPESTIENTKGAIHDVIFGKSMSVWLETMDATAVHMHSANDLMRLPILKLKKKIASHKELACSALPDAVGHFNKNEVRKEMQQIETEIKNLLGLHRSRVCANVACAKIASCSTDLLRCGRCGERRYCSQACSRK